MARGAIAVGKTRSIVQIRRGKRTPREVRIEPDIDGIALIVVEGKAARRGTEIGHPASDRARAIRSLIRISDVRLTDAPEPGRTNGQLVALDQCAVNRQGQKGI